jgi:uncharacterized protein with PQ loop repeat
MDVVVVYSFNLSKKIIQMVITHLVLSWASTSCWIVALFPQLWHNYKTKSVHGLSPYLLLLWLLGDSCNLIGCILLNQLPFQTYLSCYFVFNDIMLDFQYLYYNYKNPISKYSQLAVDESSFELISDDNYLSTGENEDTSATSFMKSNLSKSQIITTTTALLSISPASAYPLSKLLLNDNNNKITPVNFDTQKSTETVGLIFAWLCTVIYCSSRLPQLYHNFIRKSVDGISPLLFTFAILANLTYALSILYSDVPIGISYKEFIYNEMPYLLGSLGTVFFDGIYFWQREFYR